MCKRFEQLSNGLRLFCVNPSKISLDNAAKIVDVSLQIMDIKIKIRKIKKDGKIITFTTLSQLRHIEAWIQWLSF